MKFFPTVPSRVIQTHLPGVWSDKNLVPGALRKMLDASITRLTGLNDAREAWAALFKPGERIAIKVNTFSNSLIWTHVPLVTAVTESLQEAGIPAEQITIFDFQTFELNDWWIHRSTRTVRVCVAPAWTAITALNRPM